MGLWLKQDDGSLVEVSGGGGGGSFDGEHVLTGDPSDPAVVESVAEGQLLYDGVESDGSGGGPHDHDDYLPLSGGTVTGDLGVDGVLRLNGASESHISNSGTAGREILQIRATSEITTGTGINLYGSGDATNADRVLFYTSNKVTQALEADRSARFYGDLQVDGQMLASRGSGTAPGLSFADYKGTGFYPGSNNVATHVNGAWQFVVYEDKTRVIRDLQVDGTITTGSGKQVFLGGNWDGAFIANTSASGREYMNVGQQSGGGARLRLYGPGDASYPGNAYIYGGGAIAARFNNAQNTKLYGDLQVDGTINGTLAFGIADGIDTAEVLERAEVATMPAVDDEGVTTTDADVETVTVNEVVTALLSKVKELSARIEELEGN